MIADGNEIPIFPTDEDVGHVVKTIEAQDPEWKLGHALSLDSDLSWKPDLIKGNDTVLSVHLASRIRPYLRRRLKLASVLGKEVHVAMPLESLFDEDLLRDLTAIDAQVHLVEDLSSVGNPSPVLAQVADHRISLGNKTRRSVARQAWDLCQEPDLAPHVKGRRLEGLVCLLLSQIDDFLVVERNLRTETEELDAVVQRKRLNGERCWSQLPAPFIFAEAKNWSSRVTQAEVSVFRVKMQGKRGSVRLGLFFATNGFTSDAYAQELRFASDDITIVLIDPETISCWVDTEDADAYLEKVVRRAMLR
ncbi:MAG: restriction endonuclease [Acidobacteriia bacterium]|nr:restriction endonuclease [Terriglobia bacterium]